MNLTETIALRRSGHHVVMSWFIKNLIGQASWDYQVTVQRGTKTIIWNDGGYGEHELELYKEIGFVPDNIFINYEDKLSNFSFFQKNDTYIGPLGFNKYEEFNFVNSKRILIIRDFYNNLCSRITKNKKQERQMIVDGEFIEMWKNHAKSIVNNEVHHIKYEDWLTNNEIRLKFLQDVFGTKEIVKKEQANGTMSSFEGESNTNDYLNRFDPSIIPDDTKKLIREDNELHYLMGKLGYDYKEI
jgi:hypothetical protein